MNLKKIESRLEFGNLLRLKNIQENFNALIDELSYKELPEIVIYKINKEVDKINESSLKNIDRFIKSKQTSLISLITKETKIVPKYHYQNRWTMLGMFIFGTPLSILFSFLFKNNLLISLALPTSMILGSILGRFLDKKAAKEDRQLTWKPI